MQTHPKLLELRPNRSLQNSDFDGYKLSLAPIPTITEQLKVPVDRLVPDANQYSLLHAKLYALHNHLSGESGESESVYFVDKDLNVQKFCIETELNQFSSVAVWQIPMQKERISGDYNVSMKFASEEIAVVADGMGYLYVLDRAPRSNSDEWKIIFSGDVAGPGQNFVISDVVYKKSEKPELHLLLVSIRQTNPNERYSTLLHWITLLKTNSWNQIALRELTVKGVVQYANLEHTCEAVYIVSDAGCKFTLDSENEICETEGPRSEKKYTWTQSKEDVTVKFPLPSGANKNLVDIKTEVGHIQVKYEQTIILEGALYQRIDPDMTYSTMANNGLEVVLQKSQNGLWPEIVEGDRFGEYIPDPSSVDEITERLAPLTSDTELAPPPGTTFNSQQVEECDFEYDKLTVFERVHRDSHNVTHKVNLGSHQVLLTVNLEKNVPSALAVRSDVDACIWQPKNEPDEFSMEHKGTLLALGYIQKKSLTSNELRNRITGRRINTLAQQQVYNFPSNDEILGIYASHTYLYVLGESFITALKL
ncbi:nudC domain-containing protein 1 [Asbolus verrucosus]|uniref:NudC domain-containing protein 1 n=1 Tax=Asbolus verrucosus TaxID=1661398 RepID=A0A482VMU2_ASBVE|nr:nudC domain-containing protein 1 [Asbolus verrucosus]